MFEPDDQQVNIFDGGITVPIDPMDMLQCDSCQ